MNKTLTLEKRGCDFWKDAEIRNFSDIGNYRVGIYSYCIEGKDGITYLMEFTQSAHYNHRTTHKRTGKELKKPIRETIIEYGLFVNTQYENEKGCWRNSKLEREIFDMHLPYTKEGILKAVNYISKDNYTDIVITD